MPHRSNRTFIGLILLIIALMVASTPALLEPASRGVEQAGIRVGLLNDRVADAKAAEAKAAKARKKAKVKPIDSYVQLQGYQRIKGGDMRDVAGDARAVTAHGRLSEGASRATLPGEAVRSATSTPPVESADGVLLDSTGCPLFAADADVASLMANPDIAQLYADKVASADDAAVCQPVFEARVKEATVAANSAALPGDRRVTAAALRGDTEQMLLETYASDMFLAMFGSDAATSATLAESLRAQLRDAA